MKVRCSKCGHVADEEDFPKGRDFFQKPYIKACPKKCGNMQAPGGASMRMFGGERPFVYLREEEPKGNAVDTTLHRAGEAS